MTRELVILIRQTPKAKLLMVGLVVWQYVTVAGMSLLGWPVGLVWLSTAMLSLFVLVAELKDSVLLLVLSIPFYVVLPQERFDSLSMWRVLFLLLFAVWIVKAQRYDLRKWVFMPWDKFLAVFLCLGLLLTLLLGRFPFVGFKLAAFLLNIYLFYIVVINTFTAKQHVLELVRAVVWSLAIIIALGFAQLFSTFTTTLDTFWVFWADNLTRLYYGSSFASVALYSNSWFSYVGGRELRMFSIMPDSQSFAYICLFGIGIGTALSKAVFTNTKKWLWSGIRFAGLALILSGTRATWVGMLAPLSTVLYAHIKKFNRPLTKKFLWPFAIILVLFAVSPLINKALGFFRVSQFEENFLDRARSIYSTSDISNQGRLVIWESSTRFALQHPWGVGLGNFITSLSQGLPQQSYEALSSEINERYNLPQKYISAHNLYLQILVETGILGLSAFVLFFYMLLRHLLTFLRTHKDREDFFVYFVAQGFLTVLWVLAASFFDVTLLNDKVLMFFFLNIGLCGVIVNKYKEF